MTVLARTTSVDRGHRGGGRSGGGSVDVGKRTRAHGPTAKTTAKGPDERADAAIAAATKGLAALTGEYLPAARAANDARDFKAARDAVASVRVEFSGAQRKAKEARDQSQLIAEEPARAKRLQQVDAVDAAIAATQPEVDAVLHLAPADAVSLPDDATWNGDSYGAWQDGEAQKERDWSSQLDADDAARAAPASVRDDVCAVDAPHSSEALTGVQLYIKVKSQVEALATGARDQTSVGPGVAGPYRLYPHFKSEELVFYVAYHVERQQNEWVVGPDSVNAFVENVDLYVGAARASLPGSKNVESSQEDGADKAPHLPSMLELEAFGQAPYQQQQPAASAPDDVSALEVGGAMLLDGASHQNGGSAFVSARNAHLRLSQYVPEARRLAQELKAQLDAGTIQPGDAAQMAVDGRNAALNRVRAKMSPGARSVSRSIKEEGRTLDSLKSKKTRDLLEASKPGGRGMAAVGKEGDDAALRSYLDEDSPQWTTYRDDAALWEQYRKALAAGEDVERVFSSVFRPAVQELGEQPAISRAIVNSAGRSNGWVTGIAEIGRAAGTVAAAYGLYHLITTIAGADEGKRWHVAAGEFGGFAGGVIGAEVGAAAGATAGEGIAWLASAIVPEAAPVILVVSLIGGLAGGAAGGEVGQQMGGPVADAFALVGDGVGAYAAPGTAQTGGYEGIYERGEREASRSGNLDALLSDALFQMDESLQELEAKIADAPDRDALEQLQLARLDLIDRRDQMGLLYAALKAGVLDEADGWEAIGGALHAP